MDKTVEQLACDVVYNPPGEGDCFYASAARALENWNPGPEERDLRLSKELPVWYEYFTYS